MQNNLCLVKVWSIFSPHPFWSCQFLQSIFCITCWEWVSHAGNPEIWLSLFSSLGWASLKNSKIFFWPTSRPPITKLMSYFHKSGSPLSFIFMSCYVDSTYFSQFDFLNIWVILFPEQACKWGETFCASIGSLCISHYYYVCAIIQDFFNKSQIFNKTHWNTLMSCAKNHDIEREER